MGATKDVWLDELDRCQHCERGPQTYPCPRCGTPTTCHDCRRAGLSLVCQGCAHTLGDDDGEAD